MITVYNSLRKGWTIYETSISILIFFLLSLLNLLYLNVCMSMHMFSSHGIVDITLAWRHSWVLRFFSFCHTFPSPYITRPSHMSLNVLQKSEFCHLEVCSKICVFFTVKSDFFISICEQNYGYFFIYRNGILHWRLF